MGDTLDVGISEPPQHTTKAITENNKEREGTAESAENNGTDMIFEEATERAIQSAVEHIAKKQEQEQLKQQHAKAQHGGDACSIRKKERFIEKLHESTNESMIIRAPREERKIGICERNALEREILRLSITKLQDEGH